MTDWMDKPTYQSGDRVTVTRHNRARNPVTGKWEEWSQKPFNGVVQSYWRCGQYIVLDEQTRTTASYEVKELEAR